LKCRQGRERKRSGQHEKWISHFLIRTAPFLGAFQAAFMFFTDEQTLLFTAGIYHVKREQIVLVVYLSSLVACRGEDVRSTAWYNRVSFFPLSSDNKEEHHAATFE
jgi:hypothetical protein